MPDLFYTTRGGMQTWLILNALLLGVVVADSIGLRKMQERLGELPDASRVGVAWYRDPYRRTRVLGWLAAFSLYWWAWFYLDAYFRFCFRVFGSSDEPCVAHPTESERFLADVVGPAGFIVTAVATVISAEFRRIWIVPVLVATTCATVAIALLWPLTICAPFVWPYLPVWLKRRYRWLSANAT